MQNYRSRVKVRSRPPIVKSDSGLLVSPHPAIKIAAVDKELFCYARSNSKNSRRAIHTYSRP